MRVTYGYLQYYANSTAATRHVRFPIFKHAMLGGIAYQVDPAGQVKFLH